MDSEFQNDRIISFLINKFPTDDVITDKHVENYSDVQHIKKEENSSIQRLLEFFKMYWFLMFVFFIILSFVLWKRFLKK